MFFDLGPAPVEDGPLHQRQAQVDHIFQNRHPAPELPQLEGGYVLGRISKPPVPLSGYTLEMRFGGETVLVETDAGLDAGTITYRGERREAAF